MIYAKQSTAVTLLIGPFLDDADGNTPETALTIAQADVRLSKNGGNMAQKNESTSCTHDELGYYTCPLDTTDTGTLGLLKLMVHESGALPVWEEIQVVTANVYDTLFSTDQLNVNVTNIAGTAQTGNDNGADINTILSRIIGTLVAGNHNPQSGDAYSRIGAAGAGLTNINLPNQTMNITGSVSSVTAAVTTDSASREASKATGFSTHSAAAVWAAATRTLTAGTKDSEIDSIVTAVGTTLPVMLAEMEGAGFVTGTDSLEAIRNRGDAAWTTGAGGSSPTVEEIRAEMDTNSSKLIAIVDDTNELQGNQSAWATATGFIETAEFEARTIPAADYFDPTSDQVEVQTNNDKEDYTISAAGVIEIMAGVVEGTTTLAHALQDILAATAGKMSGGGTATIRARDVADTKNRLTVTVDANGNRTAVIRSHD